MTNDIQLENIFVEMRTPPTETDRKKMRRAYDFAKLAHDGQKRLSGEPYFIHAFYTAKNLADFGMDAKTICAGLLHDVIEDTEITEEEFFKKFGKEITFLVNGVTKLGTIKYRGRERYAESMRKLLLASLEDIRVLMIKLADRLHNVETLEFHTPEKAKKIAIETIQIYEPIIYRLGMGKLIKRLQDATFPYAYPKEYLLTKELMHQKKKLNQKYIERVWRDLKKEMAKHGMRDVKTDYRIKGLYSLWRKLKKKHMDAEQIYDIIALRIVVPTVEDCYRVLGIIHTMWRPLPGRIKDYISREKINGYQSIHTTIFTGDGGIAEIQIRTKEMHEHAEYGFAAHHLYKTKNKKDIPKLIKDIGEIGEDDLRPESFLNILREDILSDRIFVFTPDGDTIDLPADSTPIDFAYRIHTDLGNHIFSAQVNGKHSPLKTKLKTGDIVEVTENKKVTPNRKWLRWVKTSYAQKKIHSYLNNLRLQKK